MVTVQDSAPTPEYDKEAKVLKERFGNQGLTIEPRSRTYLGGLINRTVTEEQPDVLIFPVQQTAQEVVDALTHPGSSQVAMVPNGGPGTNHAIATHTAGDKFWLFDPMVGEITLPVANVLTWLQTRLVAEHFAKWYLSATRLVIT